MEKIAKTERVRDKFGRYFWRVHGVNGHWIQFGEFAGWTKESAEEAFKYHFDKYWKI